MSDQKINVPFPDPDPRPKRRSIKDELRAQLDALQAQVDARDREIAQLAAELKGDTLRMSEVEQKVIPMTPAQPEPEPLVGWRADVAARLGGRDRLDRLVAIADARGLDLGRPHDFAEAEDRLWRSIQPTVSGARCLAEAEWAYCQREKITLTEWEPRTRAQVTMAVGRERPDLVPTYGSRKPEPVTDPRAEVGRLAAAELARLNLDPESDKDRATAMAAVFSRRPELARQYFYAEQEPTHTAHDDAAEKQRAVAFAAKVDEVLKDQDCVRSESNISRARAWVVRNHPELAPVYGSGRPRR